MNSIRFSLRYLSKARGSNITRIVSLTLGLSVSLLIFSYVSFLLSFDRCVPDKERIYQMWSNSGTQGTGLSSAMNAPFAPSLKQDMPQIEAATHIHGLYYFDMMVNENTFSTSIWAVDTSFCDVFGLEILSGDNPHHVFATDDQIMLSQSLAQAAFPNQDPIGQHVRINNVLDFVVGGVFKDLPINTSLGTFNVLAPFNKVTQIAGLGTGWNGGDSFPTFIKLFQGSRVEEVEAQMPAFYEKYGLTASNKAWKRTYFFQPLVDSSFMTGNTRSMVRLLSILAFLLLFVATMNYVLVSLSGLIQRSRTIALLKCNGAHKIQIFHVFLSETVLLMIGALGLSVLLLLAFAKPIEQWTAYPMRELFAWNRIWTPALVLIVAFLLSGLIPARLFTKVPIEAAFKGITDTKRRWKHVLLGVELACITCVVALLWITSLQFKHLSDGDFGYDIHNLIKTEFVGRLSQYEKYVTELEALPEVASAGNALSLPIYGYSGMPCLDENTNELLFSCRWEVMDSHYIPCMKMEMVEGCNFNEETNENDAIVNQEYVRLRNWSDSPIGHQIIDNTYPGSPTYTIVGVVKDFRIGSKGEVLPLVMHPMQSLLSEESEAVSGFVTMIRLHQLTPETLEAVTAKIKTYESANNYNITIYDQALAEQLTDFRSLRNVIGIGSLVTLLIAVIGLLGYLTDECNRRSREIAIRKVNGATVGVILRMLCQNDVAMVLLSVGIGLAAAYVAAGKILQSYSARIALSWWLFAGSAVVVIAAVYLIQFTKTWRTANSNPATMLKTE